MWIPSSDRSGARKFQHLPHCLQIDRYIPDPGSQMKMQSGRFQTIMVKNATESFHRAAGRDAEAKLRGPSYGRNDPNAYVLPATRASCGTRDLVDLADAINVDHADAVMYRELDRITCLARTIEDDSFRQEHRVQSPAIAQSER